jgi:hypothetical protein
MKAMTTQKLVLDLVFQGVQSLANCRNGVSGRAPVLGARYHLLRYVSDVADRQADYVRCNDHYKFPKRLLN